MTVILFEDARVADLYPATLGRPAFAISCGSSRLADQAAKLGHSVRGVVRPHLAGLMAADMPELCDVQSSGSDLTLLVNARLVPSAAARRELVRLLEAGRPGMVRSGDSVAAALLSPDSPRPPGNLDFQAMASYLEKLKLGRLDAELPLIEYPHDIVRFHLATMNENLEERLAEKEYREIADGVFVAPGAVLGEHVVCKTSRGPIVLESGASIGPYTYLEGPVHVGPNARVIEHAAIKDFVSLAHTTKVGGEVEASIIEAYSNKQHHGFLGHSYVGSWVNLGAGTCNSDLKNTYGQVNMQYGERRVATNMQFVGTIVGDYAKTAINTGIFTGKTIGACSMVYGFVTTNVPSFVNYARTFGQVTATTVEVLIATQARMFARRNLTPRPCDVQLLNEMFDLTRHERELGSVSPDPLPLSL